MFCLFFVVLFYDYMRTKKYEINSTLDYKAFIQSPECLVEAPYSDCIVIEKRAFSDSTKISGHVARIEDVVEWIDRYYIELQGYKKELLDIKAYKDFMVDFPNMKIVRRDGTSLIQQTRVRKQHNTLFLFIETIEDD